MNQDHPEPDLRQLQGQGFSHFVESTPNFVLAIVHPLRPLRSQVQDAIRETISSINDPKIEYAEVDCTLTTGVGSKYNIEQYPCLVLHLDGELAAKYKGPHRPYESRRWLERCLSDVSEVQASAIDTFIGSDDVVVLAQIQTDDTSTLQHFVEFAQAMKGAASFGYCKSDVPIEKLQGPAPKLMVYNNKDQTWYTNPWSNDFSAMEDFLKAAAEPLITEYLVETHRNYFHGKMTLAYIFVPSENQAKRIADLLMATAKKYKNEIQFGIVAGDVKEELMDDMHIHKVEEAAFAIRNTKNNLKYPMPPVGRASFRDAVEDFVMKYVNGQLPPTIRSLPIPLNEGALVVVVGKTYNKIVLNKHKDVFMMFCTSWCGPCKDVLPTIQLLAKLYQAHDELQSLVTIATIDAEKNDYPDKDVRGFPWFKLYPADDKKHPLLFGGERTVDDMADFIKQHGTHHADLKTPCDNS